MRCAREGRQHVWSELYMRTYINYPITSLSEPHIVAFTQVSKTYHHDRNPPLPKSLRSNLHPGFFQSIPHPCIKSVMLHLVLLLVLSSLNLALTRPSSPLSIIRPGTDMGVSRRPSNGTWSPTTLYLTADFESTTALNSTRFSAVYARSIGEWTRA